MKPSKQLTGIAGEYYVAAEISRRGYLAAITLRNSDGVDILVSDSIGNHLISIQVKTTRNKLKWILTDKIEKERSINKYFVFVSISNNISEQPKYFIINSVCLAERIFTGHRRWLTEPNKFGKIRNNSSVRQFDPQYFSNEELIDWEKLLKINPNN